MASELVIEAGVDASSERSAADEIELEFVLNDDDDEEHSLLFNNILFGCGDRDFSVSSSSSSCMATIGLISSSSCLIFKFPGI